MITWEKVSTHYVAHEHYENHRNGPETVAFPYGNNKAGLSCTLPDERDYSAHCANISYSFSKICFIVINTTQWKDKADVYGYHDVRSKSKQEKVKE